MKKKAKTKVQKQGAAAGKAARTRKRIKIPMKPSMKNLPGMGSVNDVMQARLKAGAP